MERAVWLNHDEDEAVLSQDCERRPKDFRISKPDQPGNNELTTGGKLNIFAYAKCQYVFAYMF